MCTARNVHKDFFGKQFFIMTTELFLIAKREREREREAALVVDLFFFDLFLYNASL